MRHIVGVSDMKLSMEVREAQEGDAIAQDEYSSVVWGMPGEAVKAGAAEKIVSLQKIAEETVRFAMEK